MPQRNVWGLHGLLALLLRGRNFRLHMDNIACVIALSGEVPERGGSSIPGIQNLVIDILELATDHKIQLTPIWIPRAQNERSDLLSRLGSLAHFEYHLCSIEFQKLDAIVGKHAIDMLSTFENAWVSSSRFCSMFFDHRAEWTDALSILWKPLEVYWLHPPPKLVGAALTHMVYCGVSGTLVTPPWRGASWWPILYQHGHLSGPTEFCE